MKWSSIWVAAFFAALTFAAWAWLNRPNIEPRWPARVQGVAYSPYRSGQSPRSESPTLEQIDADLRLLSRASVNALRTYSSVGTLAHVPEIAARHNLKILAGARLAGYEATDEKELASVIAIANRHSNVIRVIVGNETLLHREIALPQLIAYLDVARERIQQPVSTAEPWNVWLQHPELAEHVDFLAVHMLPYWEGIAADRAIAHIDSRMEALKQKFPGREIVIAEVGWPSEGRPLDQAVASLSNEATFLRRFLDQAERKGYLYYVMEAFDQPWKARVEGTAGAYWGIYDVERKAKFAFTEPVVRIPGWRTLATVSVLLAALMLSLFYAHSTALGTRGRSFLAVVVYGTATAAVLMMYDYSQRYLTLLGAVAGAVLMVGLLGAIAILLAEAHEWVEARWSKRNLAFVEARPAHFHPKVSIHVPAFNEPAPMLIATLDALARLDYPNFEVLVIDNNTPDENVWRPVLEHCARLGARFKFFHVDPLSGFKAGALNYALEHTARDADVIAVIDSDYQVEPTWLHDLIPAFSDPKVAIVQAPQDYRDDASSLFKAMTHAEYRGFFFIGMVTRNERNAIIQHGTMTLVRKEALAQVSGWAEWCITEDAELGLRLFELGWRAHYIPRSYGRGLVPDTFADYKKQRFRWVYGAMQIVRAHREALIGLKDHRLTRGQRYHFIAGWLPWFAEGFNLLFNLAAIAWSVAMLIAPHRIDPPLIMFSVLPLSLFTFKMAKLAHLYLSRVGANIRQTIAAAIAGLALSHTVGLAVLKGLVTKNEPFFRTPKYPQQHAFSQALTAARQELLLLLLLCATAYALTHPLRFGSLRLGIPEELTGPDISLWVAVLLIQAAPYAAALVVSVISATKLPAGWLGARSSPIGFQSESKRQEPDATQSAHRKQ